MDIQTLKEIAKKMVAPGKGILAADESNKTADKRLASIKMKGDPENRRHYRDLFLDTHGIEDFLSGVILFDETIRQKSFNGTPFPELLSGKGILPGIKVDTGAMDFALFPGEKVTEGLDGLRERLQEYYGMGARFCKWRAVITIDEKNGLPTDACILANAHAMARYAALCQESNIIPIVEPEVLLDGSHTIEKAYEVTEKTLKVTFEQLKLMQVAEEGVILKSSMVLPGNKCGKKASTEEIADKTIQCLFNSIPQALPGVVFLSGGQTALEATENLNAIVKLGKAKKAPWQLSFSYARALQGPSLEVWQGRDENKSLAREVFMKRLKCNRAAREGNYNREMENSGKH